MSDAATVEFDGTDHLTAYDSLLDVDQAVSEAGGVLNGWGLAPSARNKLMRVRDADGRPMFTNGPASGDVLGTLLGAPVRYGTAFGEVENLMGVAGDFSKAQWGSVEAVRLDISTESTLTETYYDYGSGDTVTRTLNLWQRNMFALRAEVEYAFRADTDAFVRLTDAA